MVSNCHQFLGQRTVLEGGQRVEFMSGKNCVFLLCWHLMGNVIISIDKTIAAIQQ